MDNIDFNEVKKKSIRSVLTLTQRTVILQVINLIGYFLITIFLERSAFGLFILISAFIDILGYFSDVGLAAALIQKKKKVTLEEIRSSFTIQQFLVLLVIAGLMVLSPIIRKFYQLDKEGMWLLFAFAFAFFLSSLKTIPSILLERKLEFGKIVIPQFIEAISFNLIVIILAMKGFGIRSYTFAVLARSLLGVIVLYLIAPWKIGLNFSFKTLKQLLRFGVPYQLNTLLAVVKDKFTILILGKIIGNEGIALIGWAEKWATMPLRYFLDNTVKVAFPAFARLQHDKEKLKKAIEKSLYFLAVLILPALVGIGLVAQPLVETVPRYIKWQPAVIPLYLYCFASLWGSLAVFLTTILNAVGKIKTTFKLMILWTVLTWLFTPLLASKLGFLGVSLAVVLVNITSFIGIFAVKKYVEVDFLSQIKGPLISSFLMFLLVTFLKKFLSFNLLSLFIIIMTGLVSYSVTLFLLDRERFLGELQNLKKEIKNKL